MHDDLTNKVLQYETQLLHCNSPSEELLNKLIADDFEEFGSSGNICDKGFVVKYLLSDAKALRIEIHDFKTKLFADDLVQATYKSKHFDNDVLVSQALRSSFWQKDSAGNWQVCFHQGTPTT